MQGLRSLAEEIELAVQEAPDDPRPDSIAAQELATFDAPELLETAYGQGRMLAVAVRDHLEGMLRALTEPVLTITPWTSARSAVESAALSCWFMDPEASARERVARSFAFRYEGVAQQVKLARAAKNQESIQRATRRMAFIAEQARSLGFKEIVNSKGQTDGAGKRMPSVTDLTAAVLDCGSSYRVMSAMVHQHPWALQQLGFRGITRKDGSPETVKGASGRLYLFQKGFPISASQFLAMEVGEAVLKAHLSEWRLFGRELSSLDAIRDGFYQQVRG